MQTSAPQQARKMSASLLVLACCVIGVAISLFGMNYWQATRCAVTHTAEEAEEYLVEINKRILTAESQTIHNALLMERVVSSLQTRLVELEGEELAALSKSSQDEALRVSLLLSAHAAPIQPIYDLDPKYEDAEVLADKIDDLLGKVNDGGDDDDMKDKSGGVLGGSSHKWASLDDDKGTMGLKGGDTSSSLLSDAEAIKLCKEWKVKYSVAVGISWGNLPYDLQQRWLKTKCDVYLNTNADFEIEDTEKEENTANFTGSPTGSPTVSI